MRDYWGEEKFKPLWWPEDITFNKLKLKSKKDLLLIIESYKAFFSPDLGTCSSTRACDKSPIMERKTYGNNNKYETPKSVVIQGEVTDIDTSNDSFFPTFPILQPDLTSFTNQKETLAILSNAKPLLPIYQSICIDDPEVVTEIVGDHTRVEPPKILSEEVRSKCIQELSNPNTFLSDTTINAFSVSYIK